MDQQVAEWKKTVVIEGTESDWKDVLSSVPQGTVLGGTSFTLYLNDRCFSISTKAKIASTVETDEDAIVLQKDTMVEWARKYKMTFNVAKCNASYCTIQHAEPDYTMGDVV